MKNLYTRTAKPTAPQTAPPNNPMTAAASPRPKVKSPIAISARGPVMGRGPARKPARFPWFPLVICGLAAGFFIFGPHSLDDLSKLSHYIEFDGMTPAAAESADKSKTGESAKSDKGEKTETAGKKENAKNEKGEKTADGESSANPAAKDSTKTWTQEEIALFKTLEQRKKDLDRRESDLNKMEEELQKQKTELEARLKSLEDTRHKIAGQLSDKVTTDQERVEKLVTMFADMKPANAANVFKDLNEDLAVEILGKMKQKNAAEILNLLPAEKAQKFTEKFAGYRRASN